MPGAALILFRFSSLLEGSVSFFRSWIVSSFFLLFHDPFWVLSRFIGFACISPIRSEKIGKDTRQRVHFILADFFGLDKMHICKPDRDGTEKGSWDMGKRNEPAEKKRGPWGPIGKGIKTLFFRHSFLQLCCRCRGRELGALPAAADGRNGTKIIAIK